MRQKRLNHAWRAMSYFRIVFLPMIGNAVLHGAFPSYYSLALTHFCVRSYVDMTRTYGTPTRGNKCPLILGNEYII